MQRRTMLGAAAVATPAALSAPAIAQTANPEVRWRLTSSFPRNLDILYGGSEVLARRVAQLTDNRFQIRTFPAGEVVPGLQVLDAVQAGTLECGQTAQYYYTGKEQAFAFFTSAPFGLNARQMTAWLRRGGGDTLANELLRDFSCIGLPFGETGAQMGGWFRNEVRSPSELNGLKFRVAGFAGSVFQRLGAVPTQIAAGDIYPALERGTLDAAEFIGPYDDEKLGFARVARFYYAPGFWEASARGHLLVNQRAWDALPATYKAALETAAAEGVLDMVSRYDDQNPQALRRLVAAGAQLRAWPREVMQAAWRASHELYEETASQNPRFRKVWESYRSYRDDQYQWFRVAENSFENFAYAAAQAR
jgi:TRAP-type mannitol/chloroaromatic compound transport system substrate-binding protein